MGIIIPIKKFTLTDRKTIRIIFSVDNDKTDSILLGSGDKCIISYISGEFLNIKYLKITGFTLNNSPNANVNDKVVLNTTKGDIRLVNVLKILVVAGTNKPIINMSPIPAVPPNDSCCKLTDKDLADIKEYYESLNIDVENSLGEVTDKITIIEENINSNSLTLENLSDALEEVVNSIEPTVDSKIANKVYTKEYIDTLIAGLNTGTGVGDGTTNSLIRLVTIDEFYSDDFDYNSLCIYIIYKEIIDEEYGNYYDNIHIIAANEDISFDDEYLTREDYMSMLDENGNGFTYGLTYHITDEPNMTYINGYRNYKVNGGYYVKYTTAEDYYYDIEWAEPNVLYIIKDDITDSTHLRLGKVPISHNSIYITRSDYDSLTEPQEWVTYYISDENCIIINGEVVFSGGASTSLINDEYYSEHTTYSSDKIEKMIPQESQYTLNDLKANTPVSIYINSDSVGLIKDIQLVKIMLGTPFTWVNVVDPLVGYENAEEIDSDLETYQYFVEEEFIYDKASLQFVQYNEYTDYCVEVLYSQIVKIDEYEGNYATALINNADNHTKDGIYSPKSLSILK